MNSQIVVKKRKYGKDIWWGRYAYCELHPDLGDWIKDKLGGALGDLLAVAPSLIFSSLVRWITIVNVIANYGALKKTVDQAKKALEDIISGADYSGAESTELELFQDDTFDEILVDLNAWSEDDLKNKSCQVPYADGEVVVSPYKYSDEDDDKHFAATYRLDPASMASGDYLFIFGAQDSGWSNDVATISALVLKWRRQPIKHRFPTNSLGYLLELVDPRGPRSLKDFASLVGEQPPVSLIKLLRRSRSEKWARIDRRRLTFFWHNLGLFPEDLSFDILDPLGLPLSITIPLYEAKKDDFEIDRETVLANLITYLHQCQPDIAGFCELWVKDERDRLRNAVSDIYPYDEEYNWYSHEGPIEDAPGHWSKLDGGLLLLSRWPIIKKSHHVYDTCSGEDCFAAKGVLYACIGVSHHPEPYDIFITHMQSCPPKIYEMGIPGLGSSELIDVGDGVSCEEKLNEVQLGQLINFIRDNRVAGHPCILMGDLNINHAGSAIANRFSLEKLGKPIDICREYVPQNEDHSTTQHGDTFDYIFAWPAPSGKVIPLFNKASIINKKISDHKGLLCSFDAIIETR